MTDEEKKILYDMDAKINGLECHINALTKILLSIVESQSNEIKELYCHGVGHEYDGNFAKKLGIDPEIWSKEIE